MRASTLLTLQLVSTALPGIGVSPTSSLPLIPPLPLHDAAIEPSQTDSPMVLSPFTQPAEPAWHDWVLNGVRLMLDGAAGRRLEESLCPDVSLQLVVITPWLLKLSICSTELIDKSLIDKSLVRTGGAVSTHPGFGRKERSSNKFPLPSVAAELLTARNWNLFSKQADGAFFLRGLSGSILENNRPELPPVLIDAQLNTTGTNDLTHSISWDLASKGIDDFPWAGLSVGLFCGRLTICREDGEVIFSCAHMSWPSPTPQRLHARPGELLFTLHSEAINRLDGERFNLMDWTFLPTIHTKIDEASGEIVTMGMQVRVAGSIHAGGPDESFAATIAALTNRPPPPCKNHQNDHGACFRPLAAAPHAS